MYSMPYLNNTYNAQANIDRINAQMAELEEMKKRLQQPPQQPSINQTFQLTPNQSNIKYANNIEEVNKELVFSDTPFFTRDLSQMWLKNTKGEIKVFELNEIVPKDERDLLIESLQMQVNALRKEIKENAKPINNDDDEPIKNETTSDVSISRTSTKKSKRSDGNA